MNYQLITANLTAIILAIFLLVPILTLQSSAYYSNQPSVYDLSIDIVVDRWDSDAYYEYLYDNGWIKHEVTKDDFYCIYILVDQLTSGDSPLSKDLILAQIALESRFDPNAHFGGAIGLMQLVPLYHQRRLAQFIDDGHQVDLDDFYNPRLNIATGINYMEEIIDLTNGNEIYALMTYNQGPASAYYDYIECGYISNYAETITDLAEELSKLREIAVGGWSN